MRTNLASSLPTSGVETGSDRLTRATRRIACRLTCALSEPAAGSSASVVNLSQHGCALILEDQHLRCGQFVRIRLEQGGRILGIVRWVRADRAGIEFARPIRADEVTRLVSLGKR